MDEEQLYYKEKYFKYKLKYLTLKEELEGGMFFKSKKTAPVPTGKPTVVNESEYTGKTIENKLIEFMRNSDNNFFKRGDSKGVIIGMMEKAIQNKNPTNGKDYDLSFLNQVKILIEEFNKKTISSIHLTNVFFDKYLLDKVTTEYFTKMI
jgi:hypothetical protein